VVKVLRGGKISKTSFDTAIGTSGGDSQSGIRAAHRQDRIRDRERIEWVCQWHAYAGRSEAGAQRVVERIGGKWKLRRRCSKKWAGINESRGKGQGLG